METIYSLFKLQVTERPDALAVMDDKRQLTYAQLDRLIDTIASKFLSNHPKFIGIVMDHGVEMIAEYFGLTKDNVMCFGDGGNDISMLKYASIGVAMGNAADKVKDAANYVTTSIDDNGISNALKHFNII